MRYDIAMIGAGKMAEAIARGILRRGVYSPGRMAAADVAAERRAVFDSLGIATFSDNAEAVKEADIVLLSVKPQMMSAALATLAPGLAVDRQLLISIAAGVSSGSIAAALGGSGWRIVRAMPNTPMLIGQGMTALAPGAGAGPADVRRAREIFQAAGEVIEIDESKMNAVTAVSGSGPAYVFFLVEQMVRAGIELGLTQKQAHQLSVRTAVGAAAMLADGTAPGQLRRDVTSPNGTTHAAITHLESAGWDRITIEAIKAAERRGRELGG